MAGAVHTGAGSSSHAGPVAVVGSSQPEGSSSVAEDVERAGGTGSAAGGVGIVTGCEGGREADARVGAGGTAEGMAGVTGFGGSLGLDITQKMQSVNTKVTEKVFVVEHIPSDLSPG